MIYLDLLHFCQCVATSCHYFSLKQANEYSIFCQTTRVRFVFDEEALVCSLTFPKSTISFNNVQQKREKINAGLAYMWSFCDKIPLHNCINLEIGMII